MKLLNVTSLYYLLFSIILFLAGGVIFYFQLRELINEDATESIFKEKDRILRFLKDSAKIPEQSIFLADKVNFSRESVIIKEQLQDTLLYNTEEEEYQPYKQLVFPATVNEQNYSVTISNPMLESEDLLDTIVFSLLLIAGILLILLVLLSRLFSKKLWKPFYDTVQKLQSFEVSKTEPVNFPTSKISEFNMLNREIQSMTQKVKLDYYNLKNFTENASHEIQTPLAIMRSKMELLMQTENLSEEQMKWIQETYEAINRLSKLSQSLLLLSNIENRQFQETEIILVNAVIEKKLSQFEEMISWKNISVEKKLTSSTEIKMNSQLADILLSNIIGNAIKHNIKDGKIIIELHSKSLIVSNTGNPLEIPTGKLFQRFQKSKALTEADTGPGLGLSIIHQICETYNFSVTYHYSQGIHKVSVHF